MKIRDVMNINAFRVLAGSSVGKASEIAAFTSASDLVVVDEENTFKGVLSEGDLMRAALPTLSEIMDAGGELPDAYDLFQEKARELSDTPIDAYVIEHPITVSPEENVQKAAALMAARNIRRLPVVEDTRLVGTISRADICRAVFKSD